MRTGFAVAALSALALLPLAACGNQPQNLLGFNTQYHGVNVGNWLIPENWMSHVFDGVVAWDLHSLVQKLGQAEATRRVEHHRSTFMNEGDFSYLKWTGVNSVRLAFGYWDVENTQDYPTGGLVYMDKCFEWAKNHGITVLLDFHGLPGSQNADAHSGTTAGIAFQNPDNVAHALKIVEFVVRRYKDHPAYIGIDLANEPVTCGPDGLNNGKPAIPVDVLKKYYYDAYDIVRNKVGDQKGWFVFDTPYGPYPGADPLNWWQFMMEGKYTKTANDYHYYQLYTPTQTQETMDQHLAELGGLKDRFIDMGKKRPMVAGEWSFALPDKAYENMNWQQKNQARKLWAAAQLKVYENWLGFYFFNYKSDVEDDNWSFTTIIKNNGWPHAGSTLAALPYEKLTQQLIELTAKEATPAKSVAAKMGTQKTAVSDAAVQTTQLAAIPQPQWRPGMRGAVHGAQPHPVTGRVDQLLQTASNFGKGHVSRILSTQPDGWAILAVIGVVGAAIVVYGSRAARSQHAVIPSDADDV